MTSSIGKILSQYAQSEAGSPDRLIAQDKHLGQVFTNYIHSGKADFYTLNMVSQFLKNRLTLIESCKDKRVRKQELTRIEQLIISVDELGNYLRAAFKQFTPPTQRATFSTLTSDLLNIVVSMSDMADKARMAACQQTRKAVSQDPVYQFRKILKIMINDTTKEISKLFNHVRSMTSEEVKVLRKNLAEKIMQSIKEIELPNSNNPHYLSKIKKIKMEILAQAAIIKSSNSRDSLSEMGSFLQDTVDLFDLKSIELINEFIVNPFINGMNKNEYLSDSLRYYACMIDLPNNGYLGPLVARGDYCDAMRNNRPIAPGLKKYSSQVQKLISLTGPLNIYDRWGMQMTIENDSDIRDLISGSLNDPQFMRALFLLNQLLPSNRPSRAYSGKELVDILYRDQKKITDPQLIEAIVRYAPSILKYADPHLLKERKFLINLCQIVEKAEDVLLHAEVALYPDEMKDTPMNDAKFMLAVLDLSPKSQWPELLKFVGDLRQNREFRLNIVKKNSDSLHFLRDADAHIDGIDDPMIVKAAVQEDGGALEHASERCKGDRDIVLTAIRENGRAFAFAATQLRDDREVVVATFHSLLRADRQMLLHLTEDNIEQLFSLVGDELKKDPEVIALYQKAKSLYLLASAAIQLRRNQWIEKGNRVMQEALKLKNPSESLS